MITHARIMLLTGALLLAGCATPGGGFLNTNTPADAGPAPTAFAYTVRSYLGQVLKDPNSLIDLTIAPPIHTSCAVGIYGPFYGWRVMTQYNAKNSFGGYVGLQVYYYWFHGEELVGVGQNPTFCPEASGWRTGYTAPRPAEPALST